MDWGDVFWGFAQRYNWSPEIVRRLSFPLLRMYAQAEYSDVTKPQEQIVWFTDGDAALEYARKIKNENGSNIPTS